MRQRLGKPPVTAARLACATWGEPASRRRSRAGIRAARSCCTSGRNGVRAALPALGGRARQRPAGRCPVLRVTSQTPHDGGIMTERSQLSWLPCWRCPRSAAADGKALTPVPPNRRPPVIAPRLQVAVSPAEAGTAQLPPDTARTSLRFTATPSCQSDNRLVLQTACRRGVVEVEDLPAARTGPAGPVVISTPTGNSGLARGPRAGSAQSRPIRADRG